MVILASAIFFGWIRLDVPLYYDEAYTIGTYAGMPARQIVTDYSAPNNHIANSLMLHFWGRLIGDPRMIRPDTWILRVPAALWFTVGVLAFFMAARRLVSPDLVTAASVTAFFACQARALEYAGALRGYGPSLALMAVFLALITHPPRPARHAVCVALVVFALNYFVPSNLWFTGAAALAMHFACRGPDEPPPLIASGIGLVSGFALTGLAYLPVLDQMRGFASATQSPGERLVCHFSRLLEETSYGLPIPLSLLLLIAGAFVILRRGHNPEARRAARFAIPFLLVVLPVAAVISPSGFSRNYLPAHAVTALVYAWAVMGTAEAAAALAHVPQMARPLALTAFLTVALASGAVHTFTHQSDRQANRVMALVKQYAHPASAVLVGEDAELAAHRYYAYALEMQLPVAYFKLIPAAEIQKAPELWFLTSSPRERDEILAHCGISPAVWRAYGHAVRTIGRIHIEVLTKRALPAELGARAMNAN